MPWIDTGGFDCVVMSKVSNPSNIMTSAITEVSKVISKFYLFLYIVKTCWGTESAFVRRPSADHPNQARGVPILALRQSQFSGALPPSNA